MQKKSKVNEKPVIIVRTIIAILISNLVLLGLIGLFETPPPVSDCQASLFQNQYFFKLPAIIKTRFEKGKDVFIVDHIKSLQVKATLWEHANGEYANTEFADHLGASPRSSFIVSTTEEKLKDLYNMQNAEILPYTPKMKQFLKKEKKATKLQRKRYEVFY